MLFLRCLSHVANFTGDSLTPSCCLFIGRWAGLWLQLQMKALKCWTVQINESIFNLKLVLPLITIEGICRNVNLSLETQKLQYIKRIPQVCFHYGPEESAGKPS